MANLDQEFVFLRRGLMLLALHAQFPLPLTRAMLERAVGGQYAGATRELDRDIAYLDMQKLIEVDTQELHGHTYRSYKLLPGGFAVAERRVIDPCVQIGQAG